MASNLIVILSNLICSECMYYYTDVLWTHRTTYIDTNSSSISEGLPGVWSHLKGAVISGRAEHPQYLGEILQRFSL